jgi:ADP-dependent NAD(P)H-hydrate dehydratase / NAD(P)H-hydrate epimerase
MLKILSGQQVKLLDSSHIQKAEISSLDLMECAAFGFVHWWTTMGFDKQKPVFIFCGAGNNGGDGFAIGRLLYKSGYKVSVFKCFADAAKLSEDAKLNFKLLPDGIAIRNWKDFDPKIKGIVIDAFLGVGLLGDLRPEAFEIIQKINSFQDRVISVDLPSGLPSDDVLEGICVKADWTVTFAFPKLSLLFPEHASVTGELVVVDIGIKEDEYLGFNSSFFFLQKHDIPGHHKEFHRFSHKGDFGKVLLISGSEGKMGAAVLACKAALRSGSGLVSALVPKSERQIVQTSVPEAMCLFDLPKDLNSFDALGIGPGLGLEKTPELQSILQKFKKPLVLDADAITILGENPELIPLIPRGSILTPHLKEFDRLFGKTSNHKKRLVKATEFCQTWNLNLVIKGANSVICLADGRQIFNSSGTHYMATGGSGDVLTGVITSFLGQGYSPENALVCGVYHHGLAGEIASKTKLRGMIASDIIEAIPQTFIEMKIS